MVGRGGRVVDVCCPWPHLMLMAVAQSHDLRPCLLSVLGIVLYRSMSSIHSGLPRPSSVLSHPFMSWFRLPLSFLLSPQNFVLILTVWKRNSSGLPCG